MPLWIDAPLWPRHGTVFAHLVSDTSLAELHAGAARAGLHPRSFHGDHYDVAQERYDDAVGAGASPTTGAHVVRLLTASGLRLRKRRGDRPVGRVRDVPAPGGGLMDVDLLLSPVPLDRGRVVAVAVLVRDDADRVLLVHTPGRDAWGLPGGGLEAGESPTEGAVRELREETGLSLDPGSLAAVGYERLTGRPGPDGAVGRFGTGAVLLQVLSGSVAAGDPAPQADDVDEARWATPRELEARCGGEFWWPLVTALLEDV